MPRRLTREQIEELALTVSCPICGAGEGAFCTSRSTGYATNAHALRKQIERTLREGPLLPPTPLLRRALAVVWLALLFGPFIVGIFFIGLLPAQLRSLPGGLIMVWLGSAAGWAAFRAIRPDPSAIPMFGFLGRHPRIAFPLFFVLGLAGLGFGLPCLADATREPDRIEVSVTGVSHSGRGADETIRTTGASYRTAWFWNPHVRSGSAVILVGHYSRLVVEVEQS